MACPIIRQIYGGFSPGHLGYRTRMAIALLLLGNPAAGEARNGHPRISPAMFACQTRPVPTSRAVSQPPPWQKVSMHVRQARSK